MKNRGFTIIELVVVLAVMAIAMAVALPRFRLTPSHKVRSAANQLVRDLELARTRALGTKRKVRVQFDVTGGAYTAYLDDDGNGTIAETAAERTAYGSLASRTLEPDVLYGRGTTTGLPGDPGSLAVTFSGAEVDFGTNGVTVPFGTSGNIYVVSRHDSKVVAAVSVTGAGSFKVWRYAGGSAWQ